MKDDRFDKKIVKAVCEEYGVSVDDLKSKRRFRNLLYPRHTVFYLLDKYSKSSLKEIGQIFNRDHTTVVNGRDIMQDLIDTEKQMRERVERLEERYCSDRTPRKRMTIKEIASIISKL